MIEDAIIYVNGEQFKTRLHEHGKEPLTAEDRYARDKWLYSGYMEGTETTLNALKASAVDELIFHCEDQMVVLSGIVWGNVVNMYDEHFILHMNWKKEKSNHPKSLRGVKDEEED